MSTSLILMLAGLAVASSKPAPSQPAPARPSAAATAPAAPARPAKLGLCVACHGDDGASRAPGTPHLGGQDRIYLERALADYRSGKRQHVPMTSLANTLQPRDIQALAAWYAAQPGFRRGAAP